MDSNTADVIVIGSGPGGEGAAMQLAKSGKRVKLIERFAQVGGGCTHWGTIPSKALRFSIYQLTEVLSLPLMRACGVSVNFTMADLKSRTESIVHQQESLRRGFFDRNQVEVIHGEASFVDAHTLEIDGDRHLQADFIVLATGSRPYRPAHIDFSHARIFDSDSILSLDFMPRSMTIYGAGVIGCEYASMLRHLGIKINLINSRHRLLDFLDDEISDALSYNMRENGIVIRHNEQYSSMQADDDYVELKLESGKQIRSDVFLWAAGRTGNSDRLKLERVGMTADSRGYLKVNEFYQTDVPHIYAVGDLVGFPSLASAAYTQGRAAANHCLGDTDEIKCLGEVPSGIYTSPEISSIGKTERELTEACIPYEVGVAQFRHLARAQILGRQVGMLKILFHRETLEILGIHCFGSNAAEIIHIGQAVMDRDVGNTLKYFMRTTFNYPTMAEAYRVAALNGFNRVKC
ncbi:MAG: Si-specific NAD(P)(+) transhydrogenase [Pirellulaceae bacterium]|nr:Si-specific NAD(P)(+) transhydrogenase [Pirellulaceae bacterium]